jgi:hypothetical protein
MIRVSRQADDGHSNCSDSEIQQQTRRTCASGPNLEKVHENALLGTWKTFVQDGFEHHSLSNS